MSDVTGSESPGTTGSEYNTLTFVIGQLLSRIQTVALVQVIDCTNDGGLTAVGTVTVQPMVNQMTGKRQAVPHGNLFNVPYFRMQGGTDAVILDPKPGDIGLCCFCSRDISNVKKTKAQANPGSAAMFDWADGLYIGGVLNGVPQQYVRFSAAGIELVSPTLVKIQAPNVEIDASTQLTVTSPASEFSGNIHTPGTITGDTDVVAHGTSGHTHVHSGVQSGGSNSGPPV